MYKRVVFGEVTREEVAELKDINSREALILFLLAVMVLAFGVYPAPVFDVMHVTVENLINHSLQSKL